MVKISYCKFGEAYQKNTLIATNSKRLIRELKTPGYQCSGEHKCEKHKSNVRDQKATEGGKGAQIPKKLAMLIAGTISDDVAYGPL